LAQKLKHRATAPKGKPGRVPEFSRWEEKLQHLLGTKVRIGKKKIELFYYSPADLERLLSLLLKKR